MARFGEWRPLASNWFTRPRMSQVDILSLHTMVGSLTGTDGMWRRTGYTGNHSHFGVGGQGECWQWQDTLYRAAADNNGSWHIISVETADVGAPFPAWNLNDGSAVPAWTDAQCETLAQLIATMCREHNIPCQLIPDSKPGRRGIGFHRLGVPGYMVAGGEQWSSARGKVCPGNRRIAQIPSIITRANEILTGEDDMPTAREVADALLDTPIERRGPGATGVTTPRAIFQWLDANLAAIPNEVLNRRIPRQGGKTGDTTLSATIAWADANLGALGAPVAPGQQPPDPR